MTGHNLTCETPASSQNRISRTVDSSLVFGIVAIALLLSLFVFEFSRILRLAGKVNHESPIRSYEAINSDGSGR